MRAISQFLFLELDEEIEWCNTHFSPHLRAPIPFSQTNVQLFSPKSLDC